MVVYLGVEIDFLWGVFDICLCYYFLFFGVGLLCFFMLYFFIILEVYLIK